MSIKIDPVLRLSFDGRDLGIFTEAELLKLRDQIDQLFGLDRLLSHGFEARNIIEAFCQITGITWAGLKGRTKSEPLLFHRQMCMEIVRQLSPQTTEGAIGTAFGNRDHSAIHYNRAAVEARCNNSVAERNQFERLRQAVVDHIQKQNAISAENKVVNL